ncbi:unnamed protein product [Symbiodinium sp. CCMP2456]|nr:unnamed protein product [Symbiodinium sp. CCMP2456]
MKQSACFLLSSAVTWVLCNPVTAVKFTQEDLDDLGSENVTESLSTALILRSSRGAEWLNRSQDQDLDAVVSAKVFDAIAGGFEDLGKTLAKVGLKAGEAAGNAAMVVGDHVIEAAKRKMDSLPFKQWADDLGRTAKTMANGIKDAGKTLEQGVVDLADDALQHAQGLAEQGLEMAEKVGTKIGEDLEAAARAVGDSVQELEKLGPLAMAIAKETWDQIKKFVNCLDNNGLMCPILIGSHCDCPSGSSVRFDGGELVLKCVIGKSAELGMGFGFKAKPGELFGPKQKNGKLQLPGQIFEEKKAEVKQAFKKTKGGLKNKMSAAPAGSCETSLDMAIEGHVQNSLTFEMSTSGPKSTITISGGIGVSLDGMIKAQGSCKFTAEKRFPKKPKKKVMCYKAFCIVIMVQMVAQLEVNGVLTGTVEMGAEVGFDISGSVTLDKTTGKATAEFQAPSVDRQAAFAIGMSAFGSLRLGAGPFIVIFPVPGAPVNFNPMLNLELRAQGDIKYGDGLFLIQEPEASPPSNISLVAETEKYQDAVSSKGGEEPLKLCAAAALNIYIDTGITTGGFRLQFHPPGHHQGTHELFHERRTDGARGLERWPGLRPGSQASQQCCHGGPEESSRNSRRRSHLHNPGPESRLQRQARRAGRGESLLRGSIHDTWLFYFSVRASYESFWLNLVQFLFAVLLYILPKKEAVPSVKQFIDKRQLIHELGLGENFIELGNFRLGAIDDTHFSISHCDRASVSVERERFPGRSSSVTVEPDWVACQRRCRSVSGCAHFTFWPSGNCRLQSSDLAFHLREALSHPDDGWKGITGPPSHSQAKCETIQIWRADGTTHYGPRADFQAWRDVHGNLRPLTASGHSVGIHFGFEFIQIGKFRLGAADDTHFSVSHSNGNTNEIFRDDGLVCCGGAKDFGTWDRPVGAPMGISYGDRFLQLGDFRLADEDGVRFVLSSVKTKKIIQVFDSRDGKTHPNTGVYTAFSNVNRAPAHYTVKDIGVTAFGPCDPEFAAFGDRFIQLGNWRMGIFDDKHFTIAHKDGKTPEILRSDGAVFSNFPPSAFHTWNRPLGYPSGIAFGHQFIQMGNWRVAAIDDTHLSISHKDGQTPKTYSSTGHITNGPSTAHNAWSRPIGPASGVTFGDRFIQIGKFRIGDADGIHLATTYLSGVPGGTSLFLHAHWGWCGTINKHVYGPTVNARHAHWHCGSLQANMGSCPGIVTGQPLPDTDIMCVYIHIYIYM